MKKYLSTITLLILLGFISACAKNVSPDTYGACEVGVSSKVIPGVIIGKRAVKVDGDSGVGGVAGAATGATAGSAIGGSPRANIASAIGGAVIGGVAGHAIDKAIHSHKGFEYIIKLKDGATIAITQIQDLQFEINQRVLVIYGAMTRVVPDNTVAHKTPS